MTELQTLQPGFSAPSLDAQRVFRAVLEAWARPGTIETVSGLHDVPEGFDLASAVVALTLIDQDTPVWLSDHTSPAADWLRFHCGCPLLEDSGEAAFGFARGAELNGLDGFNPGSAMSPEDGATLILQADSLTRGPRMKLTGPGIETEHSLQVTGIPARIWGARAELARDFPAGIDLVVTHASQLLAIPRTAHLSWEA